MNPGEKIKAIRKARGMGLQEFAGPLGVGKSLLSRVEGGTREATNRVIRDVLRVYNVNSEWWKTGKGKMFGKGNEDQECLGLIRKLKGKWKRLAKADLYRWLAEQEAEALNEE